MTYIITPYNKAFRLSDDQFFMVHESIDYAVVQTSRYRGGPCDLDISPLFIYSDYEGDTQEDMKSEAMFYAVEWLEDFLRHIHSNPAVIHLTDDGEMFIV